MCDWEGYTTGTIGQPNPNQHSVAKTSGFLDPYICRYTARAFFRERFLALEDEGIILMGQTSRQGSALFSVRLEVWRSTGPQSCLRSRIGAPEAGQRDPQQPVPRGQFRAFCS